jgi:protein involved in polysaccharide export with SLBB domain
MGEWLIKGIYYHLIPLFCTVSAKGKLASRLATKISNEIKDLASKPQVAVS